MVGTHGRDIWTRRRSVAERTLRFSAFAMLVGSYPRSSSLVNTSCRLATSLSKLSSTVVLVMIVGIFWINFSHASTLVFALRLAALLRRGWRC